MSGIPIPTGLWIEEGQRVAARAGSSRGDKQPNLWGATGKGNPVLTMVAPGPVVP